MKYKKGDVIKTTDKDITENTVYVQYHNCIGIIINTHSRYDPLPLYQILLSGTNRMVWINETEIAEKL